MNQRITKYVVLIFTTSFIACGALDSDFDESEGNGSYPRVFSYETEGVSFAMTTTYSLDYVAGFLGSTRLCYDEVAGDVEIQIGGNIIDQNNQEDLLVLVQALRTQFGLSEETLNTSSAFEMEYSLYVYDLDITLNYKNSEMVSKTSLLRLSSPQIEVLPNQEISENSEHPVCKDGWI